MTLIHRGMYEHPPHRRGRRRSPRIATAICWACFWATARRCRWWTGSWPWWGGVLPRPSHGGEGAHPRNVQRHPGRTWQQPAGL